jgi:hypothetical protein
MTAKRPGENNRPAAPQDGFTQPDRTYRDGDPRRRECILARVSERLESQSDPLPPASAAAIARELMHI